jgi:hypothetical protein
VKSVTVCSEKDYCITLLWRFALRLAYERGRKVLCPGIFTTGNYAPPNKNKDSQLGVQNQIKFAELVANATSDPFPRGKWTSAGRGKGMNDRTNFISATLIFINLFTR